MDDTHPCTPRLAGFVYLINFIAGGVAMYLSQRLALVSGQDSEGLLRVTFIAYVVVTWSYIGVTALLYRLFAPVDKTTALVAAYFSLIGCAVLAVSCVLLLAPFSIGAVAGAGGITQTQAAAFSLLALKIQGQTFNASMVFFGWYCLLTGSLVYRSGFLPRIIGLLLGFAGIGWLTFLYPPLVRALSPYVLIPGVIGEGTLTLWLIAKGVRPRLESR